MLAVALGDEGMMGLRVVRTDETRLLANPVAEN